jgi:hypothetical protein
MLLCPGTIQNKLLKALDFDSLPNGPTTVSTWQQLYGSGYWYAPNVPADMEIMDGALLVHHPAGVIQVQDSSCNVTPQGKQKYILTQRVTLDSTFDHGAGPGSQLPGKIGFGLGRLSDAGLVVSNGSTDTTGWLLRLGFVDDELSIYSYFANRVPDFSNFGENIMTGVTWQNNTSYLVQLCVELNTPGVADGVIRVDINGQPVVTRSGVLLTTGANDVNLFNHSSFHGGGQAAAPAQATTLKYEDVTLECIE